LPGRGGRHAFRPARHCDRAGQLGSCPAHSAPMRRQRSSLGEEFPARLSKRGGVSSAKVY
jgi:hypothetical protein